MLPSTKLEFRAPAIHHYRLCMPIFNEYATTAIFLPKKPPIVVNMRLFSDCCFAAWFFVMQMSLLFSELFSPWNDISSNMTLSHKRNVVVCRKSFDRYIFWNMDFLEQIQRDFCMEKQLYSTNVIRQYWYPFSYYGFWHLISRAQDLLKTSMQCRSGVYLVQQQTCGSK